MSKDHTFVWMKSSEYSEAYVTAICRRKCWRRVSNIELQFLRTAVEVIDSLFFSVDKISTTQFHSDRISSTDYTIHIIIDIIIGSKTIDHRK